MTSSVNTPTSLLSGRQILMLTSKECINCTLLSGDILVHYMQNIVPVAEQAGLSITFSQTTRRINDISCDRYICISVEKNKTLR